MSNLHNPCQDDWGHRICFLAILLVILAVLSLYLPLASTAAEQDAAAKAIEQPLPFSHKKHVSQGLECQGCHSIPDPGFAATYPSEETCMACHSFIKTDSPHIEKLVSFKTQGEQVPWVRIYRVPDYVWFSHASHVLDAAVECDVCHGLVAERDVLFQEKPTTMASCMDCHSTHGAPLDCDFCHDPG